MTTPADLPLVAFLFRRTVVYEELVALTRQMIADGLYRPLIICTQKALANLLPADVVQQSTVILFDGSIVAPSSTPAPPPKLQTFTRPTGLRHRIKQGLVAMGPLRAMVICRGILIDRLAASRIFRTLRPAGLVVFDDRAPRPEMIFLKVATALNIPSVLAPFAASSIESDIYTRRNSLEHFVDKGRHRWLKRLLARRYPSQAIETPAGPMLFFGLWDTLAVILMGLANTRPWLSGGGQTSKVAVFSPEDADTLTGLGLAAQRIAVTGQPSNDLLHHRWHSRQELRLALAQRYGLDPARPLVIAAVPHSAEHGLRSWDEHIADTDRLLSVMAESGAQALLSLHPKSSIQTYQEPAHKYGHVIATEKLSEILPAADIFLSGFSSTARWAIQLGIPTVIADLANIGYTMYNHISGLDIVSDADALRTVLRAYVENPEARAVTSRKLLDNRSLGSIDGQACRRICNLATAALPVEKHSS